MAESRLAEPATAASHRNPWPARLVVVVALVAASGAGYLAGRTVVTPPADPLTSVAAPVTYTVVEQTISRSLRFTAIAEWDLEVLPAGGQEGVVTSVNFQPGEPLAAGSVLFTVGLRPVIVAPGLVPSFRDMSNGMRGADIAQLQELLRELRYLDGPADGVFGASTEAAVLAFQRGLDVPEDGVVRRGDLLFVSDLPTRLVPTERLFVGSSLTGSDPAVAVLPPAPSIVIPLSPDQRGLVPANGKVTVAYPGGVWHGVIARAIETADEAGATYELVLEDPDGGALCGGECDRWVPPGMRSSFDAEVDVVPETVGPVVPTAALITAPDGSTTVERADGTRITVQVIASTAGVAVVEGIDVGDQVILPFSAPAP